LAPLAVVVSGAEQPCTVARHGRLRQVGNHRRTEVCDRSRLRSAAAERRDARARVAEEDQALVELSMRTELAFRITIGACAVLLIVLVAAIGIELARESSLSI